MDCPTNMPRDHPERKRNYYAIVPQVDGTMDVYLFPDARAYRTEISVEAYGRTARLVRGVVPWNGLEEDIRARYDAWCESGEIVPFTD